MFFFFFFLTRAGVERFLCSLLAFGIQNKPWKPSHFGIIFCLLQSVSLIYVFLCKVWFKVTYFVKRPLHLLSETDPSGPDVHLGVATRCKLRESAAIARWTEKLQRQLVLVSGVFLQTSRGCTWYCLTGRNWPAGRSLDTPDLYICDHFNHCTRIVFRCCCNHLVIS